MLGYLSGKVLANSQNQIILKLPTGIGYIVSVSPELRYLQNENLEVFILEVQKEDRTDLYGFGTMHDRNWAEKLMKVNGVGAKAATNIIFTLGWEKVVEAIQKTNADILSEVKGLGAKTAKKILLELKGSLVDLEKLDNVGNNTQLSVNFTETLSNLGYKRGEIVSTITKLKKAEKWHEDNLMDTVKEGLKLLSKK